MLESRIDVAYQHEPPASECAQILTRWRFVLVKTHHFLKGQFQTSTLVLAIGIQQDEPAL
jgi:hypothetical protein